MPRMKSRERIDEARPIIHAAVPAWGACKGHRAHLFVQRFPARGFPRSRRISRCCCASGGGRVRNHLLLGAACAGPAPEWLPRDWPWRLWSPGSIRLLRPHPAGGRGIAAFEIPENAPGRRASRPLTVDDEIAHRGGQANPRDRCRTGFAPGARLEVEKSEHKRAGQPEERGGEGDAHSAQRGGKTFLEQIKNRGGVGRPGLSELITLPMEPMVSISPQNVPSSPRKTSKTGHVAGHVRAS